MKVKFVAIVSSLAAILSFVSCGGGSSSGSSATAVALSCGAIISPALPVTQSTGTVTQYVVGSGLYSATNGNYTSAMNASLTFSTAKPLAANLSNVDIASAIVEASIDDGLFSGTLVSTCLGNQPVLATTDAGGNLTALQFKLVYPQLPITTSTKINTIQFDYASGSLTASANNDALCTSVGSDGYCQASATPSSSASISSAPSITVNSFPTYSAMFVFGASGSDTGRHYQINGSPSGGPYWKGRYSNGPAFPDYLASNLGIPASNRTVYSVGGALTGRGNVSSASVYSQTGMLDQLDTFTQSLGSSSADSSALYVIHVSGNDYKICGFGSCTPTDIDQMVTNVDTLIRGLSSLGARNFLILGQNGSTWANSFSSKLATDVSGLTGVIPGNFVFFDPTVAFSSGVTTNGNLGGFSNLPPSYCYTGDMFGNGTICSDVWTYILLDTEHSTTRFAHFYGDKLSALLKL